MKLYYTMSFLEKALKIMVIVNIITISNHHVPDNGGIKI